LKTAIEEVLVSRHPRESGSPISADMDAWLKMWGVVGERRKTLNIAKVKP
jgi:hypothetical protein